MKHADPFDGNLDSWHEVEGVADWDAIVLGNGASINVWNEFQYASLFEQAKKRKLFHEDDAALFDKLGVENFEQVLHSLSEGIRIGEALDQDVSQQLERHKSIQKALAEAVRVVHVQGGEIPLETLETIRKELRQYRHVLTTSYDLLVYCLGQGRVRLPGLLRLLLGEAEAFVRRKDHPYPAELDRHETLLSPRSSPPSRPR